MQAADSREADDVGAGGTVLDRPPERIVLAEAEVCPVLIVVVDEGVEHATEMVLVQHDDVVEQFPTNGTDEALGDPVLLHSIFQRKLLEALGEIAVRQAGGVTTFDFGEWRSEMASRKNPDGTVSLITTTPGVTGFEFVVGGAGAKRTLITRDAQHEYVFTER